MEPQIENGVHTLLQFHTAIALQWNFVLTTLNQCVAHSHDGDSPDRAATPGWRINSAKKKKSDVRPSSIR
jgi:hypothetical protein